MDDLYAEFELVYDGSRSEDGFLEFYDASTALLGFQRSLALTTHLLLNGEIIVQAPSLKGAAIFAKPPEPGSWKIVVLLTGLGAFGTTALTSPRDTVLGHITYSLYDYVVESVLGVNIDFNESLGETLERSQREFDVPKIGKGKIETLVEKCEKSIAEMHRPIVKSGSAENAQIFFRNMESLTPTSSKFDHATYNKIGALYEIDGEKEYHIRVTSYNSNTYVGRAFVKELDKVVPFEISTLSRKILFLRKITRSLDQSVARESLASNALKISAIVMESRTGIVKKIIITGEAEPGNP